jgi:hypothetical protein
LASEAAAARDAANAATSACREIVDRILVADAAEVAREWVAAVRLAERLQDQITGFARVSGGALLPSERQADLLNQVDRREVAIAADPRLIENHHWKAHLDGLSAEQERRWNDYARRLMISADATFDVGSTQ